MALRLPQAVESCRSLLVWMVPVIEAFPRARKFTFGDRLVTALLDVLEALVEAAYSKRPGTPLARANRRLAVARLLWRTALDMKMVDPRRHRHAAELMVELGKQIGGWQRYEGRCDEAAGQAVAEGR